MLGWHFLAANRRLQFGTKDTVESGTTYTATGRLVLCKNGMHASRRALDALSYAPGSVVCRVRLSGEILHDRDKSVARSRQVLWMADATMLLHEFALSVATDALELTDTTNPQCWAALEVKARWLRGGATDQELDAARAAARAAAWDAAWDAARAAAWDAARAAAARAAARDAARAAAWDAAWDAARAAAARAAAARAAAWDAAWDAARDAYNTQLEIMLEALK